MEIITFTEKITDNSKHYPEFTDMRIILNTETSEHRMEVFNDINSKTVSTVSIQLRKPFSLYHKFGSINFNAEKNRYYICLKNTRNGDDTISMYLSKYIYMFNNGIVKLDDNYEIDHKNGDRVNDSFYNLTAITSEHNKSKDKYSFWLSHYNKDNNTDYKESDLINTAILNKIIDYFKPIIGDLRKIRKENYMDKYKKEQYTSISKQRKQYREQNRDLMVNASKNWRDNNRDYIKEKTKEYNDSNRDIINERNNLSRKIEVLLKKEWTKEIGLLIKQYIERILELWNITLTEISQGLSTLKYKHHTINNLNKLKMLYYEQETKLM